ncbi:MAG: tetratricopeptide repeat protein [Cyanobacteria bacterium P01_B01_bin.77]
MVKQRRNRAKVLTQDALQQLKEQIRQHELEENAAIKYSLEKLGELTGLDPETVKKVLDRQGADKRSINRCCTTFGVTLTDEDYISANQLLPTKIDPSFVGREEAIAHLKELINRNTKIIVIQARGGVGKTTLARRFLSQEFDLVLEFPIAKETKDIASIESLLEEKLRQLGEEPGREFMVSCDRLKRKLQSDRIGILIDNLEPALDSAGRFIEPHRRYVELLRILVDPSVQSTTFITTRERLRETSINTQIYLLKNLNIDAWKKFLQSRDLAVNAQVLESIHSAYGGNAKAMEIVSGVIAEDFNGDIEAYWTVNQDDLFIEQDLEDLVNQQFDRLQGGNLAAYKLLCRMGCYRYQDVPTVPIEGLCCLLWDIPQKHHRRVIKALSDRSLIEHVNSEYWLHPIIREEAVSRLRSNTDWSSSNSEAALFWTNSVLTVETVNDALGALESYYHYLAIHDYYSASYVIIRERKNRWFEREEEGETLGWSFYRMGLFQKLSLAIEEVNSELGLSYVLAKLNSLLGVIEWAKGNIKSSIKLHLKSKEIIDVIFEENTENKLSNIEDKTELFRIRILRILNYINLGLCSMNLLAYKEACDYFDIATTIANSDRQVSYYSGDIMIYRIFAESQVYPEEVTHKKLQELYNHSLTFQWGTRGKGYGLICLAMSFEYLGDLKKASELYQEALAFAEDASYTQVKGKALNGLSSICKKQGKLEEAIELNLSAIELFEVIGAKFDLADALYLLGISYQDLNRFEASRKELSRALKLFCEIDAPKQIDKIKKAM